MSQYFAKFPRVSYDLDRKKISSPDRVTNVFFRIAIVKDIVRNFSSYYEYSIRDGDRPEVLAEKAYGDPEAHWIILYANDILDPHYDWPLDNKSFEKYIVNKYKSQARMDGVKNITSWAKTNYVKYEKVIERTNAYTNTKYVSRYEIDEANVASSMAITDPYDTYNSLAVTSFETFDVAGRSISETIKAERISYYDYELRQNEKKRNIKIIKKEYYGRIMAQFNDLTNASGSRETYIRRFT